MILMVRVVYTNGQEVEVVTSIADDSPPRHNS